VASVQTELPTNHAAPYVKALPTNVRQEDADKLIKACERAEGRFKVIHAAYNAACDMQPTLFRQWEALGMTMKQLERDTV
jgi:hypothetical protein